MKQKCFRACRLFCLRFRSLTFCRMAEECAAFTVLYKESIEMLEILLTAGQVCNDWGEDYTEMAKAVLALHNSNLRC